MLQNQANMHKLAKLGLLIFKKKSMQFENKPIILIIDESAINKNAKLCYRE